MEDECFRQIRRTLMDKLDASGELQDEEIHTLIDGLVLDYARENYLSIQERGTLCHELFSSVRRLGLLEDLLGDSDVTEIMINGPDTIYVEKGGSVFLSDKKFSSKESLEDLVQKIVGLCNHVINDSRPIADARLADGSRVNAVISPAALNGPILTIRRFPDRPITMEKLIALGSISAEAAHFLQKLVEAGYSVIIGGGTSAGKTTFLNALSGFIPKDERIITIEDNAELQIQGISNLVRLEAKFANMEGNADITIRDLIKSALRMRPDRIIVGEVRSGEAVDMLQAFNTGHDGSLCTIHANSGYDMLSRLETMVLMAFPLPLPAIRRQIASGVDILVHLSRLRDRSRRVLEISEVDGMKHDEVTIHRIFEWNDREGRLEKCGELRNTLKLSRSGVIL